MTRPEHHIPPRPRPPVEMRRDPHDGIQMEAHCANRRYHSCDLCDGTGKDPAGSDQTAPADCPDCDGYGEWFE